MTPKSTNDEHGAERELMTEELPGPLLDEPTGDQGDQASRLQMLQEQAAIRAALAGRGEATDASADAGA